MNESCRRMTCNEKEEWNVKKDKKEDKEEGTIKKINNKETPGRSERSTKKKKHEEEEEDILCR